MVNEDKVKELFHISLYDSKDNNLSKQASSYYGWDYIWKEALKSFFSGTIAFAGIVALWIALSAGELLADINNLDFMSLGITTAILYAAFMVVYIFITIVIYAMRYSKGRKQVRKYLSHMKSLAKMYKREDKLKH